MPSAWSWIRAVASVVPDPTNKLRSLNKLSLQALIPVTNHPGPDPGWSWIEIVCNSCGNTHTGRYPDQSCENTVFNSSVNTHTGRYPGQSCENTVFNSSVNTHTGRYRPELWKRRIQFKRKYSYWALPWPELNKHHIRICAHVNIDMDVTRGGSAIEPWI